ncbi:MAG TPA: rhomboid family intramembrane serine protease [Sphingomicrobium sp.]|nr:rhomboid family intramembrane serine protease [Sphingomicrobium sp.]
MRLPRTVTVGIAVVTGALWLLVELMGATNQTAVAIGLIPARLSGLDIPSLVPAWLTPLTSTLVHGSFLHLLFNMLMLVWCGSAVERGLGSKSLVILYLVGAYAAAVAQWLSAPGSMTPVIGASGAVSAVIGAFALSFGQTRQIVPSARLNRWLNALWLMAAWVAMQIMIAWAAGSQGVLLATPAHVGGFLAGMLLQRPLLLWRYRDA